MPFNITLGEEKINIPMGFHELTLKQLIDIEGMAEPDIWAVYAYLTGLNRNFFIDQIADQKIYDTLVNELMWFMKWSYGSGGIDWKLPKSVKLGKKEIPIPEDAGLLAIAAFHNSVRIVEASHPCTLIKDVARKRLSLLDGWDKAAEKLGEYFNIGEAQIKILLHENCTEIKNDEGAARIMEEVTGLSKEDIFGETFSAYKYIWNNGEKKTPSPKAIRIYPDIIAIYLINQYTGKDFSDTYLAEVKKHCLNLPASDAIPLGNFFLTKHLDYDHSRRISVGRNTRSTSKRGAKGLISSGTS